MNKLIILLLASIIAINTNANDNENIKIKGQFIVIDGDLEEATLMLRNEYGAVLPIYFKSNGKFSFDVPRNQNFILSFSKRGYIKKEIEINTHIKGELKSRKVDFAVKLFPQVSNTAEVSYNQPVGSINFINGKGLFNVEYNYSAALLPIKVEL